MTNWQLALYVCSAIVAGIITKSTASAALKALALFVVTAIVTVLAAWTTTGAWDADLIRARSRRDPTRGSGDLSGSVTSFRPSGSARRTTRRSVPLRSPRTDRRFATVTPL